MKTDSKYRVRCSGSGWGVWNSVTGEKVAACADRIAALETLYELMGWSKPEKWY